MTWTKPYYGIQHLGELTDWRRASLTAYTSFVELHLFSRGVYEPLRISCDTLTKAYEYGKNWVEHAQVPTV